MKVLFPLATIEAPGHPIAEIPKTALPSFSPAKGRSSRQEDRAAEDRPWIDVMRKYLGDEDYNHLGQALETPEQPHLDKDLTKVYELVRLIGLRHIDVQNPVACDHSRESLTQLLAKVLRALSPKDCMDLAVEMRAGLFGALYQDTFRRILNYDREGIKTLVDFRGKALSHINLPQVERSIREDAKQVLKKVRIELVPHFGRACTTMRPILPDSSLQTLEHMLTAERVHPLESIEELQERLNPRNRLCFGTFHAFEPEKPVIFVHVGLTKGVASKMSHVVDNPVDGGDADTAIFFTISSAFAGLSGVDLGPNLLHDVLETLQRDLPHIRRFSTLSPMVGFVTSFLNDLPAERFEEAFSEDAKNVLSSEHASTFMSEHARSALPVAPSTKDLAMAVLTSAAYGEDEKMMATFKDPLMAFAYEYVHSKSGNNRRQLDSVGNFHLRNGAAIYSINWAADLHPRALRRSASIMVNYLYETSELWRRGLRFRISQAGLLHIRSDAPGTHHAENQQQSLGRQVSQQREAEGTWTQRHKDRGATKHGHAFRRTMSAPRRAGGEGASIEPFFAMASGARKRKFEPSDVQVFEVESLRRNLCSSPALLRKDDYMGRTTAASRNENEKEFAQGLVRRRCDELARESLGTIEKRRRPQPRIYLRTLAGRIVTLEFTGATQFVRMNQVLEQAEEVLGMPREQFRLMYKNNIVSDINHSSAEIPLGEVLHMVLQVGQ
ncbi:Malonyl-CoA decarboxylase, mitochondrial [Hondaea fermentalgiana]|uniref:Malonyl-CoA decarboxylase, mitochondrial n=1 Tax=Hondaea fermentalgiana TaxID=2315210 RepID=A0A2R5G856_9STRA|nr:Malonyl-CoA decarboxylase, mitochondrial [Hondaea fermentalgiana]|eukprot:GBG27170.1 Malonyl-CoA decarboxylase, mitochondrial [Hondaea fermentalgiana]